MLKTCFFFSEFTITAFYLTNGLYRFLIVYKSIAGVYPKLRKKKKSDVRLVKIDYFFCWKRCVRFEIKCGHRAFFERYCSFRFISVVVTSYNELINLHDVQFMNECVQLKTAHRDFNKKKNKIVYHIYYPCLSSAQNVCCIQNTRPHIITEYTKCGFSLFINEKSAFFY